MARTKKPLPSETKKGTKKALAPESKKVTKKAIEKAKKKKEPEPVVPVETKRKKMNKNRKDSWSSYLFKVTREVLPAEMSISRKSMTVMNDMMDHIFRIISNEAANLSQIDEKGKARKTLLVRDVDTAVKLLLPGELAKIARSDGKKAVRRYDLSFENGAEE